METQMPIIRAQNVHKVFDGSLHVLRGIDLEVQRGEVLVIIGPSGSGKSTFLRCLNFLEEPTAGVIEIDGVAIPAGVTSRKHQKHKQQIRTKMGMVFQQFNLFPHMTVLGNVIEGPLTVKKTDKKKAIQKGEELLDWVGLADKHYEYPSRLSGGQQQRVAIARSLAMEPDIMLFDEPTSALDPELVGEVIEVMERLAKEGMTILAVTHEMRFAMNVANRILVMDEGLWIEQGQPEEIFKNPVEERTRQFLAHLL